MPLTLDALSLAVGAVMTGVGISFFTVAIPVCCMVKTARQDRREIDAMCCNGDHAFEQPAGQHSLIHLR